jgi:hypothetical protein
MTVAEALRAAAALIEPPGAWTKDAFARDDRGHPLSAMSPKAVCWCVHGALCNVAQPTLVQDALEALFEFGRIQSVWAWNDAPHISQDHVVATLRGAADALERAGCDAAG